MWGGGGEVGGVFGGDCLEIFRKVNEELIVQDVKQTFCSPNKHPILIIDFFIIKMSLQHLEVCNVKLPSSSPCRLCCGMLLLTINNYLL